MSDSRLVTRVQPRRVVPVHVLTALGRPGWELDPRREGGLLVMVDCVVGEAVVRVGLERAATA